jgi:hypothetical protein
MAYDDNPVLRVRSLEELWGHEEEIVRRIAAVPNGGRLLLVDPRRLLRELGVEIDAGRVEECGRAHPELFARTGREHAYDRVAQSQPGSGLDVTVSGLFRRGAS